MPAFLLPISTILGISSADVIVAAFCVIFLLLFVFLGSGKLYSALFSSAIGLGIYLVLGVLLLSPQANPNGLLFPPNISKFLVESSAYLPIILGIMGFAGDSFGIKGSSHKVFRFIEPVIIGVLFLAFFFAICVGLINKSYVFGAETFLTLAVKSDFIKAFLAQSEVFVLLAREIRTVIISIMLFTIYKGLFSDVAESMIAAAIRSVLKARNGGKKAEVVEDFDSGEEEDWQMANDHGHGHH